MFSIKSRYAMASFTKTKGNAYDLNATIHTNIVIYDIKK